MTKRLSRKKRIAFYIIMIGFPLILVEILVRVYFATQVGPSVLLYGTMFSRHQERFDPKGSRQRTAERESNVAFHENASGRYSKYYPNQKRNDRDEFGNEIQVKINSRGFRGEDFNSNKEPGVVRVVTLGASSTFGFKNHDHQTYPAYLEDMLNQELLKLNAETNGSSGKSIKAFEVINLGIPHLRAEQIYSLFINEGLELQPDFVTFYEGINDAAWTDAPDTSAEKSKQMIKKIPLANQVFRELRYRFLSVAFIGSIVSQEGKALANSKDVAELRAGKKETFIGNLERLYEACRQNKAQLIVASQQVTSREGRNEDRESVRGVTYHAEQDMVRNKLSTNGSIFTVEAYCLVHNELMDAQRQWAVSNGIPYADVITAMNSNRQYLVSWVHLNADGNQVIASVLKDEILKSIRSSGISSMQMPSRAKSSETAPSVELR